MSLFEEFCLFSLLFVVPLNTFLIFFAKDYNFLDILSLRVHSSPSFLGGSILFGFSVRLNSIGTGKEDRRCYSKSFDYLF
jgi:hypothetical protein